MVFDNQAVSDLTWLIENDRRLALKVMRLIDAVQREPFAGAGKPEPLRHNFSGAWSRRISEEHRLVYSVSDTEIRVLSCRFH